MRIESVHKLPQRSLLTATHQKLMKSSNHAYLLFGVMPEISILSLMACISSDTPLRVDEPATSLPQVHGLWILGLSESNR